MATVQVRYIVSDVDAALRFYCEQLGFQEVMHPAPAFAMIASNSWSVSTASAPRLSLGGRLIESGCFANFRSCWTVSSTS